MLGLIGVFVPLFSIMGAVRLGGALLPRGLGGAYPLDGASHGPLTGAVSRRVRARAGRRLMNAIGGAPSQPADSGP